MFVPFSFSFFLPQCVVRVCCIRSFGHFLTNLQGNVLHFNPEAGIFTSISQSEQDNLVQQAKAQSRMVSYREQLNHKVALVLHERVCPNEVDNYCVLE